MSFEADPNQPVAPQRGFMFGELLVAVLFLAIAISSVTALMYSVGRHPRNRAVDCTAEASATLPECVKSAKAKAAPVKASNAASEGTTLRSRTDSASVRLVAKKPKSTPRPDLGFVR